MKIIGNSKSVFLKVKCCPLLLLCKNTVLMVVAETAPKLSRVCELPNKPAKVWAVRTYIFDTLIGHAEAPGPWTTLEFSGLVKRKAEGEAGAQLSGRAHV